MLSKVISHRDTNKAKPAVFPGVMIAPAAPGSGSEQASADQRDEALREMARRLEAAHASEKQEAFEAGRQQGDRQARAELLPVLERLHSSVNEVIAMRPDLRLRAEKDVVQLALLIARRILHREMAVDENALTAIARVAFERLTRSESYSVTVHPRFASAIKAALPGSYAARVRIEPDPDCAPGTLVIHSSEGVIDASIGVQLEEISRGLTDRLAGA
jgi:flagellar assembly protein FliH